MSVAENAGVPFLAHTAQLELHFHSRLQVVEIAVDDLGRDPGETRSLVEDAAADVAVDLTITTPVDLGFAVATGGGDLTISGMVAADDCQVATGESKPPEAVGGPGAGESRPSADGQPGVQPGGHGGSHGPLMNEFVLSILEDRKPLVDIVQALNMTVCGVVANQSALKDGERLKVPQYTI